MSGSGTGRYHAGWHRAVRYVAQRLLLRPVVHSVTRTTVEGLDNLDGLERPFVVVANHSSHLDTAVMMSSLPREVTGHLAVGAAADYFYAKWWTKLTTSVFFNTYPIHRNAGASRRGRKGLTQQLVNEDVPVLIFPEGTRSRDGKMRPFKPGAAAICVAKNAPCVPIALLGAYDAMPPGRSWPVDGRPRVRMLVGRPMRPRPGEKAREFNDRIAARVRTMLEMQTPYVVADSAPPGVDHGRDQTQEEAS